MTVRVSLPSARRGGVPGGAEPDDPLGQRLLVERSRAGGVLVDRTQQRRDDQQRYVRVTVPDGVEEAVHGRTEGPQPHQVGVDEVDADLEADQVGGSVPDGARGERVEQGAATEAEVDQVDAGDPRRDRRPGARGVVGVRAVADGAAVVHPDRPSAGRWGAPVRPCAARPARRSRCAAARSRWTSRRRQVGEGDPGDLTRPDLLFPGDHVDDDRGRGVEARLTGESPVDHEIEDTGGAARRSAVAEPHGRGPQLHGGGLGGEREAHPRGLRLRHGQLAIGLRARPARQPVRADTDRGLLDLEGTVEEIRGHRGADQLAVRSLVRP